MERLIGTTIWDQLFGTYFMPDRRPVEFGVLDDDIPESLFGQLAYPFRRVDAPHDPAGE